MKKPFFVFLFFLSIFNFGCAGEVGIDDAPSENSSSEPVLCQHNLQWSETQTFVDGAGRDFNMTVEYESLVDTGSFSAFEAAELAAWSVEVHEFMGLDNPEEAYEMLRHGHWLVTGTNERFDDIYNTSVINPMLEAKNVAAVIYINPRIGWPCYEVENEDVKWTSAIRANFWSRSDVYVIVHEMMHALSKATTGDSDSDHNDPTFWLRLNEDSVQARVIALYEQKYYPNR